MKSISTLEGQEMRVELKYCERCGGLWLRPHEAKGVDCAGCRALLEARPAPERTVSPRTLRRKRRGSETDREDNIYGSAVVGDLLGVATSEVRA
jgi:hypothetical protein